MKDARPTTHATAKRRDDHRLGTPSKSPIPMDEMTYLVLITVTAALLTGLLALPVTMPGSVFADAETAFEAAHAAPSAGVLTTARLT